MLQTVQATSLIWAPSFCPKASGASQVRFQQLLARVPTNPKRLCLSLRDFLLMSAPGRENCVRSNAILYVECAWKSSLPTGLLRPQSLSRLPGKCRQNPSVLLLFLLSGSPTVGRKRHIMQELWNFRKNCLRLATLQNKKIHSIASNVVIIVY